MRPRALADPASSYGPPSRRHTIACNGCQQFLKLEAGSYLLEVRAPAGVRATRFKPVVVGLSGAKMEVPVEYLRSFFQRIGGLP